jgi:hypothetical protein
MSFKIFILQLTGKIKDTVKLESERKSIEDDYIAFKEAEVSKELQTFRELDNWIKSGEYERRKKEVEAMVFKGSLEYNELKEFTSLQKNKSLRNYFTVHSSNDLIRYGQIDESEKLKSYMELKEYITGGRFRQVKNEILSQKFNGSSEQMQLKELEKIQNSKMFKAYQKLQNSTVLHKHIQFRDNPLLHRFLELKNAPEKDKAGKKEYLQLKKNSDIREYFRMEKSNELNQYHEMAGSHLLSRFAELQKITGSDAFRQKVAWLKDTQKLGKSEPWKKYIRFKELASDGDILFYLKFGKSSLYKNYLDLKESFQLQRFNELKELTSSAEFLKRKAWLEDTKKWEKTDEYTRYQQFKQLKENPKIKLYFKYKDSDQFDFQKQWEVTFADDFSGKSLDTGKWTPNTFWADRLLGDNYSQPGDLQAYTGGKNSTVNHGKLVIETKREKSTGRQWLPDKGFVPVEFGYTSDTLSTIKSFWQKEGIFEAKIRFNPVKQVVNSCHLLGENVSPQITLVEMGPKSRAGILTLSTDRKPAFSGMDLKNLKRDKFYIFRIEWLNARITWKINDVSIYETTISIPDNPVHLNLTSLVVNELTNSQLPVTFEVDWIKCYRKRK